MKRYYPVLILIIIISSCQKNNFKSFNKDAEIFAKNDNHIDSNEYQLLINHISNSESKGFEQFKNDNGLIDDSKVISYLIKYFLAKKIAITESDIWHPETTSIKQDTFNINVFLENSASMDGYVKGVTEFETAIYNLLGDLKISGICDSLNLSYINKTIPYTKKNALPADIQDFIEKLEPSTFRQRGGDRSVSDLKNILSTVLKSVNNKNAAILISDFVFSPGKNADAQDYLNNQEVGIKIDFAEKIKEFDLSVVVVQLQSNFDGSYYDKTDKPIQLSCKRPYYIWILGSSKQISSLINKKILDNIKGGYTNRLVLQSIKKNSEPNYKILYRPRIGEFDSKSLSQKIINNASISRENQNKGLFGFSVAIDFSNSLQDKNYYTDASNYKLSNEKYKLSIETNMDSNNPALSGFSHLLNFQTDDLREEILRIDVIGKTPSWVFNSTSIDDSNILMDNIEQQKTLGLKFLIEGVSDAFYPKSNSNAISTLNITIKK